METWRDRLAPIIAEVIWQVGRRDMKTLRKALREAYPFSERRYWTYKVWCSEIRRQLGHPLIRPRKDPAGPQLDLFVSSPEDTTC